MEIQKVMFLDIDGVLATTKQYGLSRNAKTFIKKYNTYPFDKKCVAVINEILKATNPVIVLSSDWKIHFSLAEIADIFKINGVCQRPVFFTPDLYKEKKKENPNISLEDIRISEINQFMSDHKIEKFVVIDDLDMKHGFDDHFIICDDEQQGIKKSNIKENILKRLL